MCDDDITCLRLLASLESIHLYQMLTQLRSVPKAMQYNFTGNTNGGWWERGRGGASKTDSCKHLQNWSMTMHAAASANSWAGYFCHTSNSTIVIRWCTTSSPPCTTYHRASLLSLPSNVQQCACPGRHTCVCTYVRTCLPGPCSLWSPWLVKFTLQRDSNKTSRALQASVGSH